MRWPIIEEFKHAGLNVKIGYEEDGLRDDIRRLSRELDEERGARREADRTLDAMLGEISSRQGE